MANTVKAKMVSAFKMHGLTLRSDSSRYLCDILVQVADAQREECIDKILEIIQRLPLKSSMIDQQTCVTAVQECNAEQDDSDQVLEIIDAFSIPRFVYNCERKKFIQASNLNLPTPSLFGTADDKSNVFRERYTILHQRTCRHDLFTPPVLGSVPEGHVRKFQLKPIEYLLGTTAKLGEVIVLGMLTQLKEGKWYLEDPTGVIPLDLTNASYHSGLYCENCFVLAEGWFEDDTLHVNAFGFPPSEAAAVTRSNFGNINFFGGISETTVKISTKLQQIEQDNQNAMLVFLSDVWLDDALVVSRLKILFAGYSEVPPVCFVLCGNFTSDPKATGRFKELKENFNKLAQILCGFPKLVERSRFIFIPGPTDPGPSTILPRPPIPSTIVEEFCRRVPSAVFSTNPCRLQYCTKHIVIFREDIVTKMCRNCIKFPADGDVPKHFAKTIISQAHLCPLPLHVCPVYWGYNYSLQVYPLPDILVCADKFDPFSAELSDCTVMNPGSFARTDFGFKVYFPASRHVEDSKIGTDI